MVQGSYNSLTIFTQIGSRKKLQILRRELICKNECVAVPQTGPNARLQQSLLRRQLLPDRVVIDRWRGANNIPMLSLQPSQMPYEQCLEPAGPLQLGGHLVATFSSTISTPKANIHKILFSHTQSWLEAALRATGPAGEHLNIRDGVPVPAVCCSRNQDG